MPQLHNVSLLLISLSTILTSQVFNVSISDKTVSNNEVFGIDHYDHDTTYVLPYDSVRGESGYYGNGNKRFIRWSFYDRVQQVETKMVVEKFRKNGKRQYVRQYVVKPDFGALIAYEAKYDGEGRLVAERYYAYDDNGNLMEDDPEQYDL